MKRNQKIELEHLPQQLAAGRNQGIDMPPKRTPVGAGLANHSQQYPSLQPERSGMGRTAQVFIYEYNHGLEHQMDAGPMRYGVPVSRQEQFNQNFNSSRQEQELRRQAERDLPFSRREPRNPRNAEQQAAWISPEGRFAEPKSRSRSPQRGMRQLSPPAYPRAQLPSKHQLSHESSLSWPQFKCEPGQLDSSSSSSTWSNMNQSYQQQQLDRLVDLELNSWGQGFQPDEAQRMAREPMQPPPNFCRGPARPELEPAASSQGVADELLKIALKPVGHPGLKLSREDKLNLEEAILHEVAAVGSNALADPLRFNRICFNGNSLMVTCANLASADWLMRTASSLRFYKGHPVVATRCEAPPPPKPPQRPKTKFFHAKAYFPNSADKSNEFILALISSQNPYNTKLWGVASRNKVGETAEIVLRIDQASAADIANDGHKIHYGYGKVKIIGLKRKLAKISPNGLNEQQKPEQRGVSDIIDISSDGDIKYEV